MASGCPQEVEGKSLLLKTVYTSAAEPRDSRAETDLNVT